MIEAMQEFMEVKAPTEEDVPIVADWLDRIALAAGELDYRIVLVNELSMTAREAASVTASIQWLLARDEVNAAYTEQRQAKGLVEDARRKYRDGYTTALWIETCKEGGTTKGERAAHGEWLIASDSGVLEFQRMLNNANMHVQTREAAMEIATERKKDADKKLRTGEYLLRFLSTVPRLPGVSPADVEEAAWDEAIGDVASVPVEEAQRAAGASFTL